MLYTKLSVVLFINLAGLANSVAIPRDTVLSERALATNAFGGATAATNPLPAGCSAEIIGFNGADNSVTCVDALAAANRGGAKSKPAAKAAAQATKATALSGGALATDAFGGATAATNPLPAGCSAEIIGFNGADDSVTCVDALAAANGGGAKSKAKVQ